MKWRSTESEVFLAIFSCFFFLFRSCNFHSLLLSLVSLAPLVLIRNSFHKSFRRRLKEREKEREKQTKINFIYASQDDQSHMLLLSWLQLHIVHCTRTHAASSKLHYCHNNIANHMHRWITISFISIFCPYTRIFTYLLWYTFASKTKSEQFCIRLI